MISSRAIPSIRKSGKLEKRLTPHPQTGTTSQIKIGRGGLWHAMRSRRTQLIFTPVKNDTVSKRILLYQKIATRRALSLAALFILGRGAFSDAALPFSGPPYRGLVVQHLRVFVGFLAPGGEGEGEPGRTGERGPGTLAARQSATLELPQQLCRAGLGRGQGPRQSGRTERIERAQQEPGRVQPRM